MSAPRDSLQLDVEDVENERQRENARLDSGLELSTLSICSHQTETTPLQPSKVTSRLGHFVKVKSKFTSRKCCLKSSKAAVLILIISFGMLGLLDPTALIILYLVDRIDIRPMTQGLYILYYDFSALVFLYYPLAGFLADIRWGRQKKTVANGLCAVLWILVFVIVLGGIAVMGFIPVIAQPELQLEGAYPNTIQAIVIAVIAVVFGMPVLAALLLALCDLVAFSANVVH